MYHSEARQLMPRTLEDFAPKRLPPLPELIQVNRLDEVAVLLRTATYGEFTEFSEAVGIKPDKLWDWCNRMAA